MISSVKSMVDSQPKVEDQNPVVEEEQQKDAETSREENGVRRPISFKSISSYQRSI